MVFESPLRLGTAQRTLFLAWAKTARRSATLAEFFDARLIILPLARKKLFPRLLAYLTLTLKTFSILLKERPKLIFAQCPPIQILLPVYFYTKLYPSKYVIDGHSGAFIGKGLHFPIYQQLLRFFAQRALLTIIHNEGITKYLATWQIPYFILEERVLDKGNAQHRMRNTECAIRNAVAVICGFGADEPIQEILGAANLLPEVKFYITGDKDHRLERVRPKNLKFTGFLKEKDYVDLLKEVDLIVVLTTRPDTILSGAYEGLGMEKPLVLSDSPTLRSLFPKGAILVKNERAAIAGGIREAYLKLSQLRAEILELKSQKIQQWPAQAEKLKEMLQSALAGL